MSLRFVLAGSVLWIAATVAFIARSSNAKRQLDEPVLSFSQPSAPREPPPASADGFIGIVFSPQSTILSAGTSGTITRVSAWPGRRVSRDEVLVELELPVEKRQLQDAHGLLKSARAATSASGIESARIQTQQIRTEGLLAKGMVSPAEVDAIEAEARLARVRLEAAEEHERSAEAVFMLARQRTKDARVRSACDCTVSAVFAGVGLTVGPGASLVKLVGTDELWIRFAVPEEALVSFGVGAWVTARSSALEMELMAVVVNVPPELDGATRMFFVEARIESHVPSGLCSGMELRVGVAQGAHQ